MVLGKQCQVDALTAGQRKEEDKEKPMLDNSQASGVVYTRKPVAFGIHVKHFMHVALVIRLKKHSTVMKLGAVR